MSGQGPRRLGCVAGQGSHPVKHVLIALLRGYRFMISPLYGQVCRYHPTCSAYALEAISTHGSLRGHLARRTTGVAVSPVGFGWI